jgi:hypothetical protein
MLLAALGRLFGAAFALARAYGPSAFIMSFGRATLSCPCSSEGVEKLSDKSLEGSCALVFGGTQGGEMTLLATLDRLWEPKWDPIRDYQTVSEGEFCEVHLEDSQRFTHVAFSGVRQECWSTPTALRSKTP